MGLCNLAGRREGLPRLLDLGQRRRTVRFPLVRLRILVPSRKVGRDRFDKLRDAREAPRAHAVLGQVGEKPLLRVHRAGKTPERQAAWRAAIPAGCDAVSPIRRPREFARALGAMVAEQAGPRGRIIVLRSAVEGRSFRTAHKSQTVYHGPVVYLDNPVQRLEGASSELELSLLLVFLKDAAHRAQREYRFAVWAVSRRRWSTRWGSRGRSPKAAASCPAVR